jgi:hypothetical protein
MRAALVAVLWSVAAWAHAAPDGGATSDPADGGAAVAEPTVRDPGVVIERQAPSAQQRLQRALDADAAAARARNARVHSRVMDIRRTAQETFQPTWDLAEEHPRDLGSVGATAEEIGKSVLRSWMEQAPRFAGNRPMRQPPRHPGTVRPGQEDDPTMLERYDAQVRDAVDESNSLSAVVCVALSPGKEPAGEVTRTSGRGRFDRLARASALAAARARPLPADFEPVRACYRFAAHFATVPPVPYVSCSLEKSERSNRRCVWPLRRLVSHDVDLVSAE